MSASTPAIPIVDPALHTVLVVDDDPSPRTSFQLALRKHYNVFTAADGYEALELLREHRPDVLLLDLRMPGMSGLEVLAEAQKIDPLIAAIILTAYESLDTAKEAVRLRATRYMTKPPNIEDLRKSVADAVRVREISLHNAAVARVLEHAATFDTDLIAETQRSTAEVYAGVLHDMSNPFSVALGYLDVAALDLERVDDTPVEKLTPEEARKHFDSIKSYTSRARNALMQAYDLAQRYLRTTRTLQVAADEPMTLGNYLEEIRTVVTAHRSARERQLVIPRVQVDKDSGFDAIELVQLDAILLTQILNNLLVNALQASSVGSEVVLACRVAGPVIPTESTENTLVMADDFVSTDLNVQFTVSDRGRGMNAETLSRATMPFFTTKGEAGTGMGLSMVARLTRQLDGFLTLTSEVGSGTDATVTVPLVRARKPKAG